MNRTPLKREMELAGHGVLAGRQVLPGTGINLFVVSSRIVQRDGRPAIWYECAGDAPWLSPLTDIADDREVLSDFLRLARYNRADAGQAVLQFVTRYGPLNLCPHEEPWFHPDRDDPRGLCSQIWNPQPVDSYIKYAREAENLLRLAMSLRLRKRADAAAWHFVCGVTRGGQTPRATESNVRDVIADAINWRWLQRGEVSPTFRWNDPGTPNVELGSHGLFGALAKRLAFTVAHASALLTCSGCGEMFTRERKPRPRDDVWCSRCGKKAADRASKRRQRARPTLSP